MNIAANESNKPATHVAFFPSSPETRIEFNAADFGSVVDDFVKANPGKGAPKVEPLPRTNSVVAEPSAKVEVSPVVKAADAAPVNSSFDGKLVVDEIAKERIEAQHRALVSGGVKVNTGAQFYATGTRMADSGYATQAERKVEHDKALPFADVAQALTERIRSEQREDVTMTAGEFAAALTVNGKIAVNGLALREQAIRGLLGGRLESPALSYVLGVRSRIADRLAEIRKVGIDTDKGAALHAANNADKATIARTIAHECRLNSGEVLKLRTRRGLGDVFAIVSKRYAPADAPEVLGRVIQRLPRDAKGTWSYDPDTTAWELRADVWTPTPVEQQAVGEAFRGYTSFSSRDNGTGRLNGGGGVELLRCLNASTYVAEGIGVKRNHVGRIMLDVREMQEKAVSAIRVLCAAWGVARETVVEVPADAPVGPVSKVLEGFWWGELSNRKSELCGVLAGRKADHVAGLVKAQLSERRDPAKLVRSDFAQGWTRYIQDQPADARRDAESAVGAWLVSKRPMTFDLDRVTA